MIAVSDESYYLAPMGAATQVAWKAVTPPIVKTIFNLTPPIGLGVLGALGGALMGVGSRTTIGSALLAGTMTFGAAVLTRFALRMMYAQRENIPTPATSWGTRSELIDELYPTSPA